VAAVRTVAVTTWFLEMTGPDQIGPAPDPLPGVEVRRAEVPSPELSRSLYAGVGADWWWVDRLRWSWRDWHAHLSSPEVETWLALLHGTPAGYAELHARGDGVELAYFGLLPSFTGQGLGPRLLDTAVRRAWRMTDPAPARVWLHTCSLDSPAALPTYERRGFRRYDERTDHVPLPDGALEPWPGAGPAVPGASR
jgi:GNAT superfamily N-acetyltransferase